MSAPDAVSAEVRAAIVAALRAGEAARKVAQDMGAPLSFVATLAAELRERGERGA